MIKVLKWFAVFLGVIVLAVAGFFISMRFHDGPMEIISGGPFKTGEVTATPESWAWLKDRDTIEFQTMNPATSRTVWLVTHEDRLFMISGYMTTGYGKLWKQWPHYLDEDDRVILRIDGKLYPQRLERKMEGPEVLPVMQEFSRKYGLGVPEDIGMITRGEAWLYEVVPQDS